MNQKNLDQYKLFCILQGGAFKSMPDVDEDIVSDTELLHYLFLGGIGNNKPNCGRVAGYT